MGFEIDHTSKGQDENGIRRFVLWLELEEDGLPGRRARADRAGARMSDGQSIDPAIVRPAQMPTFFKLWL